MSAITSRGQSATVAIVSSSTGRERRVGEEGRVECHCAIITLPRPPNVINRFPSVLQQATVSSTVYNTLAVRVTNPYPWLLLVHYNQMVKHSLAENNNNTQKYIRYQSSSIVFCWTRAKVYGELGWGRQAWEWRTATNIGGVCYLPARETYTYYDASEEARLTRIHVCVYTRAKAGRWVMYSMQHPVWTRRTLVTWLIFIWSVATCRFVRVCTRDTFYCLLIKGLIGTVK